MTSQTAPTPLSDNEFHARTASVLAAIEAVIDDWLQDDVIDIDAARTGGMLELRFPNGSTIVINTQPPLHELWMAARSGGRHYRFVDGRWLDSREGTEFFEALSASATEQGGAPLEFIRPVER